MDAKRRYYWLWAAIGLLLCLNLLTIGWVVRRTNAVQANRALPEALLVKRLNFTPEQTRQYRENRRSMRQQSRPYEDSLRLFRSRLLDQVGQTALTDVELDRLLAQMAAQNRHIARLRFRHWQQVRSLCTPEQQIQFDELIRRVGQGINNPAIRGTLRANVPERDKQKIN